MGTRHQEGWRAHELPWVSCSGSCLTCAPAHFPATSRPCVWPLHLSVQVCHHTISRLSQSVTKTLPEHSFPHGISPFQTRLSNRNCLLNCCALTLWAPQMARGIPSHFHLHLQAHARKGTRPRYAFKLPRRMLNGQVNSHKKVRIRSPHTLVV